MVYTTYLILVVLGVVYYCFIHITWIPQFVAKDWNNKLPIQG